MTPSSSGFGPFGDRTTRTALFASMALAALPLVGCKHHRQAMRPSYTIVQEAPVGAPTAVEPALDCPPGQEPCADAPAASSSPRSAPTRIEPGPAFDEDGIPASAPALSPAPAPTRIEPAAPRGAPSGEPSLDPNTAEPALPPLEAPASTRRDAQRPAPTAARTPSRTRLAAFVNDPNDLFEPPKADRQWQYVVIHHSAHERGGYASIDREHRDRLGTDGCGYHFIIGNGTESPDGQIEVARRWSDQKAGAHCRDGRTADVNDYGIGICLVGDLDSEGPSTRQLEAARELVAYLRQRYDIPAENIGSHAQLAASPTACPGKKFPIQAVVGTGRVTAARPVRSAAWSGRDMLARP
jgi:N-acetyl-anhydromuramyl-L-alanine amidase AmpD